MNQLHRLGYYATLTPIAASACGERATPGGILCVKRLAQIRAAAGVAPRLQAVAGPLGRPRRAVRPSLGIRPRRGGLGRRRQAYRGAPGGAAPVGRLRPADHTDGRDQGRIPTPGESAEELERRSWTERDAAMAGRVLAAPDAVGGRLVVAGNLHTKLKPLAVGVP